MSDEGATAVAPTFPQGSALLALAKAIASLAIGWTLVALVTQVIAARGGGRRDYSRRAGAPWKGVLYSFTTGMTPAHKESVRLHPGKFALGLVMHVGVIVSLVGVVLLLVWPTGALRILSFLRPVCAVALVAGIGLLFRRILSGTMRAISSPDDYLAILATCGLLACFSLFRMDARGQLVVLLYAGLLFVYLPLGKLRHAVFFFVARGDYARRLGYRGVYPPARARTE